MRGGCEHECSVAAKLTRQTEYRMARNAERMRVSDCESLKNASDNSLRLTMSTYSSAHTHTHTRAYAGVTAVLYAANELPFTQGHAQASMTIEYKGTLRTIFFDATPLASRPPTASYHQSFVALQDVEARADLGALGTSGEEEGRRRRKGDDLCAPQTSCCRIPPCRCGSYLNCLSETCMSARCELCPAGVCVCARVCVTRHTISTDLNGSQRISTRKPKLCVCHKTHYLNKEN
jgi:hypothetical protein